MTRVHHHGRPLQNPGVIDIRVVRHDHHRVGLGEDLIRQGDRRQRGSLLGQIGHEGIVVLHVRTIGAKKPDDIQGRRFPDIVDVPLVRHTEH